jgi:mono/diheme cytochrome c family protein
MTMIFSKSLIITTLFIIVFAGPVFAKDDPRTPIVLTETERNLVLEEMRAFLDTIRSITVSLSKDDMGKIVEPAKKVGMAASGEVPPALKAKLPQQFKILAMQAHKGFDQIALDATEMADKQQTLEQLGALLGNCVACHAIYKLPTPE